MKETRNYQTKTFTLLIVHENHSQITIITVNINHLSGITTAEDLQIEEIHKISHKIDIVDQTVKTTKIEITIKHQTQTEVTFQIVIDFILFKFSN